MKMTTSSLAVFSILFFMGCSSPEFAGNSDKRTKDDGNSKDSTADNNDDGERASEPVPVGGAYLACSYAAVQDADEGNIYVGCGVYQDVMALAERTRTKLNVSQDAIEWNIKDGNGAMVSNLVYKDVPESDKYHRIYEYQGETYKNYKVSVVVKDSKGGKVDLEKDNYDLGEIDHNFGQLEFQYRVWPEAGNYLTVVNCAAADGTPQSCNSWASVKSINPEFVDIYQMSDMCKNNRKADLNKIKNNFGPDSVKDSMIDVGSKLVFSPNNKWLMNGTICFIRVPALYKEESNGCIIAPWFYQGSVHFGIFNEDRNYSPTAASDLKAMMNQFSCEENPLSATLFRDSAAASVTPN